MEVFGGFTQEQQHALQECGAFDPTFPECVEAVGCRRCSNRGDCTHMIGSNHGFRPEDDVPPVPPEDGWDY